ncbi:MAG: hypothetical protein FJ316_03115 [SAR202 cluster bacterium]|nr:hypothetical protein [SAR202 cluster bacterium]
MRRFGYLALVVIMAATAFGALGAGPEPGVPPRPYFPDFYSGNVVVSGGASLAGVSLVICIDDCATVFTTGPVSLDAQGKFDRIAISPKDEALVGHPISFFLQNQYGRIKAREAPIFEGALNLRNVTLNFKDPLPSPPPPPDLPQVGDSIIPVLPKIAAGLGLLLVAAGLGLLGVQRVRRPLAS